MRSACTIALLLVIMPALAAPVAPADQKAWLRHVIPLPKEIAFEGVAQVAPGEAGVTGSFDMDAQDALVKEALALLSAVLKPDVTRTPRFLFELALCDRAGRANGNPVPGAEKLAKLPNADQAYVIVPGQDKLTLAALDPKGLYYAALTLSQLLPVKMTEGRLTVPLVRVLDWPDLNERGLWGGNAVNDIEWMSSYKMNLVEAHSNLKLDETGKGSAEFSPGKIEEGRLHAFKVVPIITHLDQIAPLGVYTKLPELLGKEPGAKLQGHENEVAPCASQPGFVKLLSEWMTDLISVPHVTDICIWLSENDLQCACEPCKAVGQFVAETRACIQAFRIAQPANPEAKLRILLTQGSYRTNDKVLAEIPDDVNVSYYDGGRTYDSSRDPMIYPLLEEYAAKGRWLGVYPQVTASYGVVCPWSGPQFMKYRMTEFVDKKLSNLCGYATPHNRLYDFNVTAAAEWGWNAHGRDEREFAAAWATRRGVSDPEKAADWAVMLGPVGWDLYGSRVPFTAFFGGLANMIRDRTKPMLGKGYYRYFPDEAHLQMDVATCEEAGRLAAELGDPWISAETQVISGYVTMMATLYDIGMLISRPEPPTEEERLKLQQDLRALAEAELSVTQGLRAWQAASTDVKIGGRFTDTIGVGAQTLADVSKALAPFGVRNPLAPYLVQPVGEYHDADFEEQQTIVKQIKVTPLVQGPATYQVLFTHTAGWNGASIQRVALATAPQGQTTLTEITEDKHQGMIGYEPTDPTYALNLPQHDEALDYYLVINMTGIKSSDKPVERRGCNGSITMWKVRQGNEPIPDLPLLPMSESEKARYGGPKFGTNGLRVGVVQGGYGAEAILQHLKGKAGFDAQPVWVVSAENLKNCQALIVPQPFLPETYGQETVQVLTQYVNGGGGVLTLHNAVGFKGLPVLLPEVCAGGVTRLADKTWKLTAETPLSAGLEREKAFGQSYYDYIVLEPGPKGTVGAVGGEGGKPVLLFGESGKGRYVACGLGISISTDGDKDVPPGAEEGVLLENAVAWLGRR